ncbi:MAG: hypothetical protein ACRDU8_01915, partial [Egibacteraceae bacterium]
MSLRPVRPDEAELAARFSLLSFGDEGDRDAVVERTRRRIADGEMWGWDAGDGLLGAGRLLRVDHWFGGRLVPTQNV